MLQHEISKWTSCILILATLAVTLAIPITASANAGPPASPSDSGGLVLPGGTSDLRIDRELLIIELEPGESKANVTATYEITNPTGKAINQPLVFIASRGRHLSVSLNGQTVAVTETEKVSLPAAWQDPTQGLDPLTGETYNLQTGGSRSSNHWTFNIELPANGKGSLQAQYRATMGKDRQRHKYYVHQIMYVLGPAKSWAGFGNLDVQVKIPSKFILVGSLPLKKSASAGDMDTYAGAFQGVPADVLRISAVSNAVLLPADPMDEWRGWIGWGISIVVGLLIILIVRMFCGRLPWAWLAAVLGVVLAYIFTAGVCMGILAYLTQSPGPDGAEIAVVGYGEMFVIIGWVFWGVVILPGFTTPIAAIWSARTSAARRRAREQRAIGLAG